jgi:hypothetical protein
MTSGLHGLHPRRGAQDQASGHLARHEHSEPPPKSQGWRDRLHGVYNRGSTYVFDALSREG